MQTMTQSPALIAYYHFARMIRALDPLPYSHEHRPAIYMAFRGSYEMEAAERGYRPSPSAYRPPAGKHAPGY